MNRLDLLAALILSGLTLCSCGGGGGGSSTATSSGGGTDILAPASEPVCAAAEPASVAQSPISLAGVRVPESTRVPAGRGSSVMHTNYLIRSTPTRGTGPSGYSPAQIRAAYGVPAGLGQGAIAIVAANHYPTALADFNQFSREFGLPTEASSDEMAGVNTRFQVVFATGSQPPTVDPDWAQEMALDTQWAHAMAPNAKIYLVEAASASVADVMSAVNVARTLPGVTQVSMSFGSSESSCSYVRYDDFMVQNGVTFFAASGDTSNERGYPALSRNAICVGGTRLNLQADGSRISEAVWSSTAGSASLISPRPLFQDSVVSKVGRYRSGNDIAVVGDPITGVSVYVSTPSQGETGWFVFGGTSAGAPIVAGIANAANTGRSSSKALAAALYSKLGSSSFIDITTGRSGARSAGTGWDFPTGVGAPNGLSGF